MAEPEAERTDQCGAARERLVACAVRGVKNSACWNAASTTASAPSVLASASSWRESASSRRLSPRRTRRRSAISSNGVPGGSGSCERSGRRSTASAGAATGNGAGRPNSQPWPSVAPTARARARCASVSIPSASSTAPERSASAATALSTRAAAGEAPRAWISDMSSLIDVGREEGHQRERALVDADVVERDPAAALAQPRDGGEHLGRAIGERALGDLDDDAQAPGQQRGPRGSAGVVAQHGAGLDVDEQGLRRLQPRGERALDGGAATGAIELGHEAGSRAAPNSARGDSSGESRGPRASAS